MAILHTGQRLGAYAVEGLLGTGGMAEVYRATHTRAGAPGCDQGLNPRSTPIPPSCCASPARRRPWRGWTTRTSSPCTTTARRGRSPIWCCSSPRAAPARPGTRLLHAGRGGRRSGADRRGADIRARSRHHPPRLQADQRAGRRAGRPLLADFGLARILGKPGLHRGRGRRRHAHLHGAGTGAGRRPGPARGHLRARHRRV